MDRELAGRYTESSLHNYGSNSFQFFDTVVTGITKMSGNQQTDDPIVGQPVVNNIDFPFAKIVDLDVDCQGRSAIYGMQFGVQGDSSLLFYGKWTPNIIAQNMLPRVACFSDIDDCELIYSPGGESFSAQSMTTITDIEWNVEPAMGSFLEDFKAAFDATGMNKLVVRITQYAYRYGGDDASLGHVVGVIGIPSDTDTLNVPGDRFMIPTDSIPDGLDYELCGDCKYNGNDVDQTKTPWMAQAPFKVDLASEEVHVDLSLSLIMDNSLNIRDIGTLQLGIFYEELDCVELIEDELHGYTSSSTYSKFGAMYDRKLETAKLVEDIQNNPLVVVQVSTGIAGDQSKPMCSDQALPSMKSSSSDSAVILLKEEPYFVRSKGLYVGRFDQTDEYPNPNIQEVYITKFGVPATGVTPTVTLKVTPRPPIPVHGVLAEYLEYDETTGIAKFSYSRNKTLDMPAIREYGYEVCSAYDGDTRTTIPIDGQVYYFLYGIEGHNSFSPAEPVFLSHTDVHYTRPYTWVKDVSPILSLFAHIVPMMKTILDMSSYTDVTRPHNINILDKALRLDFHDPSYMPTTRNLSPAKRDMILEWLAYPLYDDTCELQGIIDRSAPSKDGGIEIPDRCEAPELNFNEFPTAKDSRLFSFYKARAGSRCSNAEISKASNSVPIPERPLFLHKKNGRNAGKDISDLLMCSKRNIARQLQTALQLEWSTIPVYLTSLYSIMDGCNDEIYDLIRSAVMQEMLHFSLVGNMLIALGEVPQIDHPNIAPSYPGQLPGCVIPELEVTLEKLSRAHIHDVFMVIELPVETKVGGDLDYGDLYTIGAFYDEIKGCLQRRLDEGKDEIFDDTTVDYQVKWPSWGALSRVGNLIPILNTSSAIEAINVIVSQGEGATMLTPKDIDDATLAHFFRFEQVYCKRHLEKREDDTYAYSGYQIPFNVDGIFNMRPNPSTDNVPVNTICYTESRMFHQTYRNFLRQLQLAFNGRPSDEGVGEPQDFFRAVQLMEALQLNAKRLMRIEFDSSEHTTCGPVWDYEWKGEL